MWTPAANSLMIVEKIPAAWLVQIRDAGYGLMYQYPEQFSKIVRTFLETTWFDQNLAFLCVYDEQVRYSKTDQKISLKGLDFWLKIVAYNEIAPDSHRYYFYDFQKHHESFTRL